MQPMSESPSAIWHQPGTIARFLETVRGNVPLAIEQIDIMLRLIAAARERIDTFLILGCGDGLLASAMLDEFPRAVGLVLDTSEAALDQARTNLHLYESRIETRLCDLTTPAWISQTVPLGPFDAVLCGFATSGLAQHRYRVLLTEVLELLKPGGIFLNIEVVASATRWTESPMDDYMIDAIFGEELRAAGRNQSPAEVARAYYRNARNDAAGLAPLEVQCDWLREIGYESVDCYLKVLELAVFGGQRPAALRAE